GFAALTELDSYREVSSYDKPIYKQPSNWTMLKFIARLVGRTARWAVLDLFTEEHWFIAWRRLSDPKSLSPASSGKPFTVLWPPRGFFHPDPFLIEHQGGHYIFFEDYDYAVERGVISYVELDENGQASAPRVVLSQDCHLSYPFVFQYEGQVYMIPETR